MQDAKPTLRVLFGLTLFIVFLLLALVYCNYQHVFTVKHIDVSGNYELDEKDIVRISGIKRGNEMFSLDLSEALQRLTAEPYVHHAYISRQFPDVIKIHVIERQPMVLIDLRETYALDAFATVIPLPRKSQSKALPVIKGIDPELAMEAGKITVHPDILHVIHFVNYIHGLGEEIALYCNHISWSEDKGWIIRPGTEYPYIYLGKEDLEKRIDILHAFVQEMNENNIDMRRYRYISLRYNGQVIVREKL
ncbi:MAG: FtsQ-type POTRA domain-containing protein [Candidatus Marinimicrobia bacterium]|jgi:cell division protein FtsQ|nr:FtsQ-type POTRA domain-containing protein [Candidatus Neomarinimicrobiota bacterium]MDD4961309.1 FtsQ-type POTRA domain-containing protein [Candidatus Neomarinimicrobiota bacterium]MDD5709426.1 FtsQ-type POTRA domain-containing protein [Candidatus Neomarinimicrobiota bacterium]MDX9777700.1 FtsQ-type POTRA domain-containing protein [bacterium]